ncbi:hypothetical protein [Paenibacillus senegalensis]|uniref:hypothetical protein n=1 Tax=Paenibacillus senegalensis TaxID=1465766 RepID=UPI000289B52B|nr:hypothetical protein [Paenibacillus senegalensis]
MGDISWFFTGVVFVLILLLVLAVVLIFNRRRRAANIVAIGSYKRRTATGQKCSLCKRKDKLQFYTMNNGQVAGVCKECRATAKKNNWERV